MILSDYIKALQAIEAEHGDLEVETYSGYYGRNTAKKPEINFRRESRPEFWTKYHGEDRKGQKVVRV